jgi:hypothetical protein
MNEEAARTLGRYMVTLCQSHTIHRWGASWEHELWDALISDGQRGHADPHEYADRLTPEELLELRRLMKEAACWHVSETHVLEDAAFVRAMWTHKDFLERRPDPETNLLAVPLKAWKDLHEAWLRTPAGGHNLQWRLDIYKTTAAQVEEIADMRDRLVELVESQPTLGVDDERVIVDMFRAKRTELAVAWLPKEIRKRLQFRWRPR